MEEGKNLETEKIRAWSRVVYSSKDGCIDYNLVIGIDGCDRCLLVGGSNTGDSYYIGPLN